MQNDLSLMSVLDVSGPLAVPPLREHELGHAGRVAACIEAARYTCHTRPATLKNLQPTSCVMAWQRHIKHLSHVLGHHAGPAAQYLVLGIGSYEAGHTPCSK